MRATQRKGDIATAKAIASFTNLGFDVSIPLTESAAYDLIVDTGKELKRIQVKYTSTKEVDLRNIHSNSSGYIIKKPKNNTFDWLFILKKNTEYLITNSLAGRRSINPQKRHLLSKQVLKTT